MTDSVRKQVIDALKVRLEAIIAGNSYGKGDTYNTSIGQRIYYGKTVFSARHDTFPAASILPDINSAVDLGAGQPTITADGEWPITIIGFYIASDRNNPFVDGELILADFFGALGVKDDGLGGLVNRVEWVGDDITEYDPSSLIFAAFMNIDITLSRIRGRPNYVIP